RAGFTGLDAADGPGALYYAVLEGVAFAIAANLEAMGGAGQGTVGLAGGGAVSRVWPQVIADVLGRPVAVPDDPVAATGRGAFRIAAAALGWSVGTGGVLRQFQPRPDRAARIDRQRRRFAAATALLRQLP